MSRIQSVFGMLGKEVLAMEIRKDISDLNTVSLRLNTNDLAKIEALSELLEMTRQDVFNNLLFGSINEAIIGAHEGLAMDINDIGTSDYFQEIFNSKREKILAKKIPKTDSEL